MRLGLVYAAIASGLLSFLTTDLCAAQGVAARHFKISRPQPDQWSCTTRNPQVISEFKITIDDFYSASGTLKMFAPTPLRSSKPTTNLTRAFGLQSLPVAVQTPLEGTTLIYGRSDALDQTQVNLYVVILLQTEYSATAEIYTELGSGQGVFKDSFICQVTTP